jgi:hypothetical protein
MMTGELQQRSSERFQALDDPEGRFSNGRLKAALFAASRTNGLLILE